MKKVLALLLTACIGVSLVACGNSSIKENRKTDTPAEEKAETNGKTLVVYFSCTGNTEKIAKLVAEETGGDIYKIEPQEPYTEADLNYNDDNSRSTKEMNDSSQRPAISGTVENIEQYDTIFLGYPIWWGEAPRIMDTFVESYDFGSKTVVPFCTSGGSGIGSSAKTLESLAGTGKWQGGKKFSGSEADSEVKDWIKGL